MTIDPDRDRPLYKQLADLIRAQIERGELIAGQAIPAEYDYAQRYRISRDSVRRAMAILRQEGLIVTERRGSHVRNHVDLVAVRVEGGTISARMPTETERRSLRISEGVPVLVIERSGHEAEIYPADRTVIEFTPN